MIARPTRDHVFFGRKPEAVKDLARAFFVPGKAGDEEPFGKLRFALKFLQAKPAMRNLSELRFALKFLQALRYALEFLQAHAQYARRISCFQPTLCILALI